MKYQNFCFLCIIVYVEINFNDFMVLIENCRRKVRYCCGGVKISLELFVGVLGEGNQLLGLFGGVCRYGILASVDDIVKRVGSYIEIFRGMEVYLLFSVSDFKSYFVY